MIEHLTSQTAPYDLSAVTAWRSPLAKYSTQQAPSTGSKQTARRHQPADDIEQYHGLLKKCFRLNKALLLYAPSVFPDRRPRR